MERWLSLAAALSFICMLIGSGVWASRRYARFDQLPGHYDFGGRPTRMQSRRLMVWMLPVLFSLTLAAISLVPMLVPPNLVNGDPMIGVIIAGLGLVGAQVFVLWLTERWARSQP